MRGRWLWGALLVASVAGAQEPARLVPGSNPIIRDKFTADPAPLATRQAHAAVVADMGDVEFL